MSREALYKKSHERRKSERTMVRLDDSAEYRVCIVYPNTYHVGMSSLGFLGVYSMINAMDGFLCERAFLPDEEDEAEHRRTSTPVFSIESGRPLADFHMIAFSVSFENDYPAIASILDLSGVPVMARDRGPRDPVVIMGGVCAFSNPEPVAELFDAVLVGEAEGLLDDFMDAWKRSPDRRSLYENASKVSGVYVPSMYEINYKDDGTIGRRIAAAGARDKIGRRHCEDISASPIRHMVVAEDTEFSGMRLVEAMRGCPWACNFCLAGHVFNPPRAKGLDAIRDEIGVETGGHKVGLIGPSLSDYKHRDEVLAMQGVDFSITSLRASQKSAQLVSMLRSHKSVSIAPEAGTERLRLEINKKVTHEDIMNTAGLLMESGIRKLRLYFMVGLPTEAEEDVEGIITLVREIRALPNKSAKIAVTLSLFVPKPHTPFERMPMLGQAEAKKRIRHLKKELSRLHGVSVGHDPVRNAYMQGLFSVGNRRLSAVIGRMGRGESLAEAARAEGIDPEFYTMRAKGAQEALPWEFIVL